MPVTDIKVIGIAHDVRIPDRAEVRLQVSKWGRDWESTHRSVTGTVGGVTDAIKRLEEAQPQALHDYSISQISQRSWSDDIGAAYSETIDITMVFTDFQAMSDWVFTQSTETVRIRGIDWRLSAAARKELNISLSVEAIRDAQRKAETFAVAAGLTIVGIQTLAEPETVGASLPRPRGLAAATGRSESGDSGIDITPAPIETTVRIDAHFLAEPETPTAASFQPTRRTPRFMA